MRLSYTMRRMCIGEVVQEETRQSYVAAGNSPEVPGIYSRPTATSHLPLTWLWQVVQCHFSTVRRLHALVPANIIVTCLTCHKKTMKRISIPKSVKRKLDSRDRVGGPVVFGTPCHSPWTTMSPTIVSRPSLRGQKLDIAVEFCFCAKVGIKCEYDFDPINPYSRRFMELETLFLVSNSDDSFISVWFMISRLSYTEPPPYVL